MRRARAQKKKLGLIMMAASAVAMAAVGVAKAMDPRRPRQYILRARALRLPSFDLDAFATYLETVGVPFECYFRLPRPLMDSLIERITPRLRADESQGRNSSGHTITPAHRVAIGLRFMAGALWQDIVVEMPPVSKTEVFKSVWMVVDAINSEYAGEWSYPTPKPGASKREWQKACEFYCKLEARFRDKSPQYCMAGVIGAIDGCIIRTMSPGVAVENPTDHHCVRKKTYGLLLMAAADADMVIRFWDISHTPRCHDSTAWNNCSLGAWVNEGNLPFPFCYLGDKAFRPGNASLLTPGTNTSTTEAFKYVQSRGRMPAEQCFGILVRTWGILWRQLEVKFERRAPLVSALIHLHNIRRTAGAVIDMQDGHETRCNKNGKLQWGIKQRVRKNGAAQDVTLWYDAPTMDEYGRPTELSGLVNRGRPENSPLQPSQNGDANGDKLSQRVKMLEDSIALHGVTRPPESTARHNKRQRQSLLTT